VCFNPTPSDERTSAEQARVAAARENGTDGVDAAGSEAGTWTPPKRGGSRGRWPPKTAACPVLGDSV